MSESILLNDKVPEHHSKPLDIAYIHHSSGTSSGNLKPIEQTHWGAAGALPRLGGRNKASFSTTPLYHGGIADCLRAWTSRAMIWLFPENEIPITAANVLSCLEFADSKAEGYAQLDKHSEWAHVNGTFVKAKSGVAGTVDKSNSTCVSPTPPIAYFSCVPYVLNIVTQSTTGQARLRLMELVGTGGTALSQSDGDKLVKKGIKLISRYGSAECGFLMSSHRQGDDDWQFLRVPKCSKYLHFEEMQDGLAELVVKDGWPHMAKRNLPNGSYATCDLFERHPSIEQAWKYHSRKDSQIMLSTGKKFDPEPLERSIRTVSDFLQDVLVFGNGKSYAGALLFHTAGDHLDDEALLDQVWPKIDHINHSNPPHAHLQRTAIKLRSVSKTFKCLPKSNKGTILRGQAEAQYKELIDECYYGKNESSNTCEGPIASSPISSFALRQIVVDTVNSVMGKIIDDDADLLREGFKSQQSQEIRNILSQRLLQNHPQLREKISLTVAYDHETVGGLSQYFERLLRNAAIPGDHSTDFQVHEMEDMIKLKETRISTASGTAVPPAPLQAIILTGATGTLGIHLLDKLRTSFPKHRLYCLMRTKEGEQASSVALKSQLSKALTSRKKASLSDCENIMAVSCEASKPRCGLDREIYDQMIATVSVVIHAAWDVNFVQPLRAYRDQFTWLASLLQLGHQATLSGKKNVGFFFCSSIASVDAAPEPSNSERLSSSPTDATPIGYSRSKWVAEHICHNAWEDSNKTHEGLSVHILRIGQLCGDTENGVWNMKEAIPLLLSTKELIGCLPRQNAKVDWLPVDIAAKSILDIVSSAGRETENTKGRNQNGDRAWNIPRSTAHSFDVYHVVNPRPDPRWNQMLEWLKEDQDDAFQIVEGSVWFRKLAAAFSNSGIKHPGRPLLPLWKQQFEAEMPHREAREAFESTKAPAASATLDQAMREPAVTRESIRKMVRWIDGQI